uniref:Beta-glucuronidase n=1 Tax=Trichuris muris TaxID=70415 RepID=A0A5S6R2E8_TRIMR
MLISACEAWEQGNLLRRYDDGNRLCVCFFLLQGWSAVWSIDMLLYFCLQLFTSIDASLYPFESETRQVKSLDGLWCFVAEKANSEFYGMENKWFQRDICHFENSTRLAVPGSYNDQTQSQLLRRHVGWVWYQRKFFASPDWYSRDKEVLLRFGSVNYFAVVWLNGKLTMKHEGGHLPFQASAKKFLRFGAENVLTVAVNNTLSHNTIPPGEFEHQNSSYCRTCDFVQALDFDFFNYAGIHRPVVLYIVPIIHITEVFVAGSTDEVEFGVLQYSIDINVNLAGMHSISAAVELRTMGDDLIFRENGFKGIKFTGGIKAWWPYGMSNEPGYLYKFTAFLLLRNDTVLDVYQLPVGIRTVSASDGKFRFNRREFYFVGFGMHEDSEIHGRGYDPVVMIKDMNLLQWFGANSFRTSHYPYSEEMLFEADRRGIVVISELPAVGLKYFTENNLALHSAILNETIGRDKNHPSVVMWSLANEPDTKQNASSDYFRRLIDLTRRLDSTRPITIVYGPSEYYNDQTAHMVDVICINRYYGWYRNPGHPETIVQELKDDILHWRDKFKKPVLVTEYGTDAFDSLSFEPGVMFSPQYQLEVFSCYHKVFDSLKPNPLIGEMVWNFADFMTDDGLIRVVGNRKGVLYRNRQPKQAAYLIRARYTSLLNASKSNPSI